MRAVAMNFCLLHALHILNGTPKQIAVCSIFKSHYYLCHNLYFICEKFYKDNNFARICKIIG